MALDPLVLAFPLLAIAAYCDLRFLRIPDVISMALVALFVFTSLFFPTDDLIARLVAAGAVFGIGFLAFGMRLVGGGDVKLLSALMLFIPANGLVLFANLFATSLLIGVFSVVTLRRKQFTRFAHWKSLAVPRAMPMGLSIAMAGLAFPLMFRAM